MSEKKNFVVCFIAFCMSLKHYIDYTASSLIFYFTNDTKEIKFFLMVCEMLVERLLQQRTEKENNNRNNMNCILLSDSEKMFQINSTSNDHTCKLNNRQRLINRAKMKSLRISVAIVAAFIICWTPYYVSMLIFMFTNPDERVINNNEKQSAFDDH